MDQAGQLAIAVAGLALIVTVLWVGFETVIYRFNGPGGLSVG